MATVTHAGTAVWATTAGTSTTPAFTGTPVLNDLIVVVAASTGVATSAVTDNNADGLGAYTKVGSTFTGFSTSGNLTVWVRNALVGSATSTTFTAPQNGSTGGGLDVFRVSGMSLAGAAAVRQSAGQSTGTSATAPAPVMGSAVLTGNPVIAAVCCGTNATANFTPRTGYTEATDLGYNTPAAGLETMFRSSGETGTTLTWGSSAPSAFASVAVELDTSVPETSPALELSGYSISGPVSGDTINSVTVAVTEHQSNAAQAAATFQLWDGATAQIGTTQTGTASTSTSNVSSATFTGVSFSQLATLRVRVFGNANTGTGFVESVDAASLVVNYTPAPVAKALAEAGTGTDALTGTGTPVALSDSGSGAGVFGAAVFPPPAALPVLQADEFSQVLVRPAVQRVITGPVPGGGGPVPMALAEAGAGADALGIAVPMSLADSGAAADTLTAAVPMALAEAGAGTQALSIAQPAALPESGSGADAVLAALSAALAESGAGTDGLTAGIPVPLAGAGSGAEALSVAQPAALAEAGSGDGGLTAVLPLALAEAGSGAEVIALPLALGDSGSGADTLANGGSQPVPLAEAGSGDGLLAAAAAVPLADAGTGADAQGTAVPLALAEAGSGADSPASAVPLALAEAGGGADAVLLAQPSALADAGGGAEVFSSGGTVFVPLPDAGSGTDAPGITVLLALPDSGSGADAAGLAALVPLADAGAGDGLPGTVAAVPLADAGSGAEAFAGGGLTHISSADAAKVTESAFYSVAGPPDSASAADSAASIRVRGADRAAAADAPLSAWPSRADTVKAADRAASAWPAGFDSGRGTEQVKPFRFARGDSAGALEVLHEMGIWTYIPANVRLSGRFWRITGTDERGSEITVLEGERLDRAVLELAARVSWSRVTRRVRSAEACTAAESCREPVAVTCWVQPAVSVSVQIEALPGG